MNPLTELHEIGEKIRLFRVFKSLIQENMAEDLKMSVSNYSKIERGEMQDIGVMKMKKIAQILNVPLKDIMPNAENNTFVFSFANGGIGNTQSNVNIYTNERLDKLEMEEIGNIHKTINELTVEIHNKGK